GGLRRDVARRRQPLQPRDDGRPGARDAVRERAMKALVVAVSARMLATLADADGHAVVALDRFGDVDLRAIAPGATARRSDALVALAEHVEADAVVYGAGLENRPDLVARRSAERRGGKEWRSRWSP